ncbi:MAG TPA: peptidase M20, partial [Acidimicrobiales bacterium]
QVTARTWEPTLATIAVDGIPALGSAGNVLRPYTALGLSFRLPPTVDAAAAGRALAAALTADPPYGTRVTFDIPSAEDGWDAPATAPWLAAALADSSLATFGRPARALGEGGTIPFMAMLGHRFPDAQFVITGVLGPGSNAHGPNEFLHVPTARRVTATVSHVLHAHATRF